MDDSAKPSGHETPRHKTPPQLDTSALRGLLLLLMAMTAIGPTTLNILVPALPEMAHLMGTDIGTIQLTVSIYLLALAAGQLVMGPLSDRYGRRPVILAGLALAAAGSVLAVMVSTMGSLIVARLMQAIGASAGIVVARAIIRDLFDRNRAASILGLVATVMVVVPTFGPLIGGLLDGAFGWEAIFLFTAIISVMVAAWTAMALPETAWLNVPEEAPEGFFRNVARLCGSARFIGYVGAGALGSATYFAFLGAGPHVIITLMGRSAAEYGVWFAISSVGYMAGNFGAARLSTRFGIDRLIWWGIGMEAAGAAMAVALAAIVPEGGPAIVFGPQMLISFGNGLLLPGAISGAVSIRPQAAGTAAGITGFAQMAIGAATIQYAGVLLATASSALPMAVLMAEQVIVMAIGFALLMRQPPRPTTAA